MSMLAGDDCGFKDVHVLLSLVLLLLSLLVMMMTVVVMMMMFPHLSVRCWWWCPCRGVGDRAGACMVMLMRQRRDKHCLDHGHDDNNDDGDSCSKVLKHWDGDGNVVVAVSVMVPLLARSIKSNLMMFLMMMLMRILRTMMLMMMVVMMMVMMMILLMTVW